MIATAGRAPNPGARPSAFTPKSTPVKRTATLTLADRCDAEASGAERAYVCVDFLNGQSLLFCAHHFAQYEDALHESQHGTPYGITDERWQLTDNERSR